MSSAKFASITSSLLARKGEARPWAQLEATATPPSWRGDMPAAMAAPPPPPPAKDRSCSVRMSAHDYERLGILAVKQGKTRIEAKCRKCGAPNRVSADQGEVRVGFTCKECGEKQATL